MSKQQWQVALIQNGITLAIVIIGAIVTVSMTSKYNDEVSMKEAIDSKASIVYVNTKCNETKDQILRENNLILKNISILQGDVKQILKDMPKR